MLAGLLITLREGLEAALIVGIVLGRMDRSRPVWLGVIAAVLTSIVAGLGLNALGMAFEGRAEAIFEGAAMLLAAGVLTWMIYWMQRQGSRMRTGLEQDVREAVRLGSAGMLFGLSYVAVLREGIETVLFLTAAALSSTPAQTLLGGSLGLLVAIGLGWLMFAASRQLDLRTFFRVTGFLLIVFAAGLVAGGVHEFQETALLPVIVEHVWDVNPILPESGFAGSMLKALFGYNGNPSLLEVLSYLGYYAVILTAGRARRLLIPAGSPA
jgi:high-affinity iron transporter